MERLNEILSNVFNASVAKQFTANATYSAAMDCIEYTSSDEIVLAVRIDEFLTLYKDKHQQKVLGFKCKGFRYIFERLKENGAELAEDDFIPLVKIIEHALSMLGQQLFSEKKSAYEQACAIARRDNVRVEMPAKLAA